MRRPLSKRVIRWLALALVAGCLVAAGICGALGNYVLATVFALLGIAYGFAIVRLLGTPSRRPPRDDDDGE